MASARLRFEFRAARRGLLALSTWRRTVVRTINPLPILRSLAQSFANRIHQDVAGFLFQFVMVSLAVIEKIALPTHAMLSGNELLPVLDGPCNSRLARERNNRVQMIRHKQAQAAVPYESLVIKFHGLEHGVASVCAAQLVFARRHTIDGDKEPTALGHPLRNCMRQLFAHREIHVSSLTRRLPGDKREKIGRAVRSLRAAACTPFPETHGSHGSASPTVPPRLISSSDAGSSKAEVSPSFSPRYAARTIRRTTFAFRVLGMSPTNKTSLGASALPGWTANAFSKL